MPRGYTPSRLPNTDGPPEQKSMIAVRTRFHPLVDTDEALAGRCGRQNAAMLTVAEVDKGNH